MFSIENNMTLFSIENNTILVEVVMVLQAGPTFRQTPDRLWDRMESFWASGWLQRDGVATGADPPMMFSIENIMFSIENIVFSIENIVVFDRKHRWPVEADP